MTHLIFALVVKMRARTLSIEHWSRFKRHLWYAKQLNSQHYRITPRMSSSKPSVFLCVSIAAMTGSRAWNYNELG